MSIVRIIVFSVAALATGAAFAQADPAPQRNKAIVYKCAGAEGSIVYSERPCSDDPRKVQQVDTSAALRTGSGGHQGEIAASVADSDCRNRAREPMTKASASIEQSNKHIAEYEQRKADLASPTVYATDSAGNLTDDAGKTKMLADIDSAIQRERDYQQKENAIASAEVQKALLDCDQQMAKQLQPPPAKELTKP